MLSEFEQRRGMQLALDELPDEQREVILLRLEQELTLDEIGAITGVGRETVTSRLRYAMDKLRARLGDAGCTPAPGTTTIRRATGRERIFQTRYISVARYP